MGKGDRLASCAFLAAAKEFPFNERINMRGSAEGKKNTEKYKIFMMLWYKTVPSTAISVVLTTIIDECHRLCRVKHKSVVFMEVGIVSQQRKELNTVLYRAGGLPR